MSGSESGSEAAPAAEAPSDNVLAEALRNTVIETFKSGNLEELTVKRVRMATEKRLQLEEGFFRNNAVWKEKSMEIIKAEAEEQEELADETKETTETPETEKPKKEPSEQKPRKRSASTKGTSQQVPETTKKRKAPSPKPDEPVQEKKDDNDHSFAEDQNQETNANEGNRSESEMSELIDEPPKPVKKPKAASSKPRQKKQETAEVKPRGKKEGASKAKDDSIDPNQAEIKRLQGWLLKCGIRKMWFRELAAYDTPKAKINHLKDMLKDVGMEGRYSLEKAKAIRERRELQQDLETVTEGAKKWGARNSDDERPKRRVARGFKTLDFLGDEGDEESD